MKIVKLTVATIVYILMSPAIAWGLLMQIWEAGYVAGRLAGAAIAEWMDS